MSQEHADADVDALVSTRHLITYLTELTDLSRRSATPDIFDRSAQAPEEIVWVRTLPEDIVRPDPRDPDLLVRIKPVAMIPAPPLPAALIGWVTPTSVTDPEDVPILRAVSETLQDAEGPDALDELDEEARRAAAAREVSFSRWLSEWLDWAAGEPARRHRHDLYERLEHAAKMMEQRDDEFEFVFGAGFLGWRPPDGWTVRRHLLTEQAHPRVDRSGTLTVRRLPSTRRLEDYEILGGLEDYRPDRARDPRTAVLDSPDATDSAAVQEALSDWLGLAVSVAGARDEMLAATAEPDQAPKIATLPAFLLRPRTKALIAEAYRGIAEALENEDADIPVGLAQLVAETDQPTRERWLAGQNAMSGDVLGSDPRFPLPSNVEQTRVMELLRTETGIVVQGPPGTGKTHTIANLISALLARGQRVLVTSQKDQALRVLREKIPAPLRSLCVLLAGGSRDAAAELEKGIEALSGAIASTDEDSLRIRTEALSAERTRLRQDAEIVNNRVRELRDVERKVWSSAVPEYDGKIYSGTLAAIVAQTRREAPANDWMPPVPSTVRTPPLLQREFEELGALLSSATPERAQLGDRVVPPATEVPTEGALAKLFAEEREASAAPPSGASAVLMSADDQTLRILEQSADQFEHLLRTTPILTTAWSRRAADDLIGSRRAGLWQGLLETATDAKQLLGELNDSSRSAVEVLEPVTASTVAETQRRIIVGEALLDHLRKGRQLRARWAPKVQREAEVLLAAVTVDGSRIASVGQMEAALAYLRAEVASIRLAERWRDVDVEIAGGSLRPRLAELSDHADLLQQVLGLSEIVSRFRTGLGRLPVAVRTIDEVRAVSENIPQVQAARRARDATERVNALAGYLQEMVRQNICVRELTALVEAVRARDSGAAGVILRDFERLRSEQLDEMRCRDLSSRLADSHPVLLQRMRAGGFPDCAGLDLAAAWAWSLAASFVEEHRTVEVERSLIKKYTELTTRLSIVTGELVAAEAMRACMLRLTDQHTRALNTYREHMSKIGAGTGQKTAEFRRAARAAMLKAQDAVPAWVVPLGNLLENLPAHRDRFDVIIVDEASQVGIEHLYLLWMAPRVIVVGDDKQCTPAASAMGTLDEVFERQRDRLGGLSEDVRTNLTPKSNLYGVLSARAGKNGLVRLREHFRCVPEIIRWSSDQFYAYGSDASGLIPLRERRADDLDPLRVVTVEGAVMDGRDASRRNEAEARALIDTMLKCLDDPAYDGKTFGVVVLAGAPSHLRLLENLINADIVPEERQARNIRVGTAPNFQGDERDVIFLSTVVSGRPRLTQAQSFQQSYNVAVSRARDQLWLVTSLRLEDLNPKDLRASLISYMQNPPSVFGPSPDVDAVSETDPTPPFDSLFEQQVFRAIRRKGYHVVPQFAVGTRMLDLVVVGAGGRVAVECDGHYWHAGVDEQVSDARRDSELQRMGWETIRVRESEFAFDSERELAPLWKALAARDIKPGDLGASTEWQPVELDEE